MSQPRPALRLPHILLVDDDPRVLSVTSRLLERAGYEVVVASSASAALTVLEQDSAIQCAMVDLGLGGISGFEVVEWLKAMRPRIRVIVATGQEQPRLPPGVAFLAKPYTVEQLRNSVEQGCR
jgi:CheY-like chemotaxis protein